MQFGYNQESVDWLETFIERIKEGGDFQEEAAKLKLTSVFGSFLGECVINCHGGIWKESDGEWCVAHDDNKLVFPFAIIANQIENGLEGGMGNLFRDLPALLNGQAQARPKNIMRFTKLWRQSVISLIAAGPAGGFLVGLLHPGDPDPNPIGRFVYACIMAVQTPLHAGFPLHQDGGTLRSYNAWPHITVACLMIFGGFMYCDWTHEKRVNPKNA